MDWNKDRGLQLRMVSLIVLLAALYSVFLASLTLFGNAFIIGGAVTAVIAVLAWNGPKIALRATDANRVTAEEHPELHSRITRLSQQANMVTPEIAVSTSDAPNAFATGRTKDSAVICVTEGLLDTLDGEELDAVLAHELSHIKNKDMTIMMIASTIAAVAHFVVRWGWLGDGDGGGDATIFVAIGVSIVTWIGSYVLMRILSKYREYAADRGAVAITGQPAALASALRTIKTDVEETAQEDLREVSSTNAVNFYEFETDMMSKLMKSHPETEKRIEKIQEVN